MSSIQQGFPKVDAPLTTITIGGNSFSGYMKQPWYQLFITLWNRTGGQMGTATTPPQSITAPVGQIILASQLVSPLIIRSGPTGDFTDTTDTATDYVADLNNPFVNEFNSLTLINTTAFNWSIAPGTGFTFSGNLSGGNFLIAANSQRVLNLYVTNIKNPAVTVYG